MKVFDPPDSDPTADPQKTTPAEGGQDSPPAKPDSEPKKPTPEEIEQKRIADTQAAYTRGQQELSDVKKQLAERDAKLERVSKYVDWDKLDAWEKEQEAKRMEEPVTVKDLQDLRTALTPKKPDEVDLKPQNEDLTPTPEQETFFREYLSKHEFLVPYAESGELVGVAQQIARANPSLSIHEVGEKAAEHFKKRDEAARKKMEADLTQKREALGGAGAPRATTSFPEGPGEEGPVDDSPGAEIASRRERLRKQRTLI